jgi:hypothetical protein
MDSQRIVGQVLGRRVRFGGEEHSGWLPNNAVWPEPIPVRFELLDVRILGTSGGYILEWASREGDVYGDLWYETVEDAEAEAWSLFGIGKSEWTPPDEIL